MMARRKRRRRFASRVRAALRSLLAFLFSNVGIVVLVVAYTVAGAFMFLAIEGNSEMERVNNMTLERDSLAQYLWQNVTLALNLFNDTALKESISRELVRYQHKIVVARRLGWDGGRHSRQWSFSSAFLYSLTVITTIGYGHLSPKTNWGKVTTIFYALLGMPLFLLYLSNVGELLARWFKCLYALVCLCRGCPAFTNRHIIPQIELSSAESIERPAHWGRSIERPAHWGRSIERPAHWGRSIERPVHRGRGHGRSDSDSTEHVPHYHRGLPRRAPYPRSISMPAGPARPPLSAPPPPPRASSLPAEETEASSEFSVVTFDVQTITVPISVCVAIMVGYLLFGSMLFGKWEEWDQLDGAYFCFISLSSIGFGDFVPGDRVFTPRIETSFIACSLYLMLGMALVAMCFNLMQEQVIHYFAGMKRAIQRICRCKR